MKTTLLIPVFFLLSFIANAQNADSLSAVKQVDSLIQISRAQTDQNDFDKALEINTAAEKLALEVLGRESAAYGSCCSNQGRICFSNKNYPEAEIWYLQSLRIREKSLGNEHPEFANSLNEIMILYLEMGRYEDAVAYGTRSKDIRGKVLGKNNIDYAGSLVNLGTMFMLLARYETAEPLFLEAKNILESKKEFSQHLFYSNCLYNLSGLYLNMSRFEEAEPLLLKSRSIYETIFGKEHPNVTYATFALAGMYYLMGNFEAAEPLYLETKRLLEKTAGTEDAAYASCLEGLANMYRESGKPELAQPLFEQAVSINKKVLGKEHPDYAFSIFHLADFYLSLNRLNLAEPMFLEAKLVLENSLGKESDQYATALSGLGTLKKMQGHYEAAERLFIEAKDIRERILGTGNYNYDLSLKDLANFYWQTGNLPSAERYFLESIHTRKSSLLKASRHMSERELSAYVKQWTINLDPIYSFAQIALNPTLDASSFNNALFYKGFLLSNASQIGKLALTDTVATQKIFLLKSFQRRLAEQYSFPIAERDSSMVVEMEAKANILEKEIVGTVAGFGDALRQVSWQDVQAKLKPEEAVIEFVHYKFSDPKSTDSIMYSAILLLPGEHQPMFVPLFEKRQLEAIISPKKIENRNELFSQLYSRGITPVNKANLQGLYKLIWKPIDSLLSGYKTVYFSPSGLLHYINFDAIPMPTEGLSQSAMLSDKFQFVRLGSTRSLVVTKFTKSKTTNTALLFGGIQYNQDTTLLADPKVFTDNTSNSSIELSFATSMRGLAERSETWKYLPGTEKEINTAEQIMHTAGIQVRSYRGNAAKEEVFKHIGNGADGSPRILHLATHGFFFPDPKTVGTGQSALGSEPVFKISEQPMIRSGLLLAGANHAWKTGKPLKPGMEDGILTAYEISQMNLSNTELVVLSACETGLGDIQGNEGVYGLQRAFKIAGAKYLIMSLWQVPDKQTSLLMTTFYKKWLEDKMTIPEAFRAAQKELRDAGLDPYQWAGFVLVE